MARRRSSTTVWTLWVAFGISCTVHVLLFLEVVRLFDGPDPVETEPPEPTSEAPKKLEVTMTREEPETDQTPPRKREQKDTEEEQKEDENEKKLERQYDRKAVVQETNEKSPEKADYVSSQSNSVEKETRARETNTRFSESSETADDESQGKKASADQTQLGSKKVAARDQQPTEPPEPETREPPEPSKNESESSEKPRESQRKPSDKRAPDAPAPSKSEKTKRGETSKKPLPLPTPDDLARLFDEKKDRKKVREHAEKGVGSDMYKRIEGNKGAVKSAMKNYITEVEPGNHTAVNAHADVAASYVNRIHSKIHPKWGGDFLPMLDTRYGPDSPFSDSSLNTVLEFVVDGETGKLEKVNIVESSGLTAYDMEAIAIAKDVAPHPPAPGKIRSPDGNVYLHWNFWRDQRQCGTFGVSIYKLLEDGTKQKTKEGK